MTEEQSDKKTCDLHLFLSRHTGSEVSYNTQAGLSRSLILTGWVDDPWCLPSGVVEGSPDSVFHDKRIRLEICAPPDSGWLDNIRDSLGDKAACGAASVEAGVKPERFELQGEMEEIEAIQVRLDVTDETLEAIWRQVWTTDDHRRLLSAKVVLSGNVIPDVDELFVRPRHLDISQKREYAVKGLEEISNTRIIDTTRGRVREIPKTRDEGYGTYISVLLSQVRFKLNTEFSIYYGISCDGRIINAWNKPYNGAYVRVDFREFELNQFGEVSEKAFFGDFDYSPKECDRYSPTAQLLLTLNYVSQDANAFLIPILTQQQHSAEIILRINLTNEEDELINAAGELRGNVRNYTVELKRDLLDETEQTDDNDFAEKEC